MKPESIVLFYGARAELLIDNIQWINDKPVAGSVVNGGWRWPSQASHTANFTRWLAVPPGIRGGYNGVLNWAETQPEEKGSAQA